VAVAFNVASESHAGTTGASGAASFTWNHAATGTPRGALVFVFGVVTNALPPVTSVTYGGATMVSIPYTAIDTDTEPGSVHAYYLDNVATGTQAIVVNRSDATPWTHVLYAVCYTVTAAGPTEVYLPGVKTKSASTAIATAASSTGTGTGTLAEDTVDDGSPGTSSLRFMGRYQGTSNVTAAGPNSTAPASAAASIDFGLFVIDTFYETTAGQGARNVGGATITDDVAAILLAVREIPKAGVGSATGTSQSPLAHVATMGGLASATGTALQPTTASLVVTMAPAGVASATGTSQAPTANLGALAGLASATGTAQQPSVRGEALAAAGLGSATGTAYGPLANVAPQPGPGSATGTARQPAAQIRATAGVAAATGTAQQPAPRAEALAAAGFAAATGSAQSPTSNPAGMAGVAASLAAAYDPTGAVAVMAGLASAVATAWDATVTVFTGGALVTVNAEVASATGTAWNATVTTLVPTTGGHAGRKRGGRPGERKRSIDPLGPIMFLIPETFAYAGVAAATAGASGATGEWNDDETTLMFLLGGLL
jgi:hypothetical protein